LRISILNNTNIAVIDDSGFGIGKPGLFGKEQYVEIISRIYEEFFGWKTFRLVISHNKPVNVGSRDKRIYWIPYSRLKIIGNYIDPVLVGSLRRFIEKHKIRIIHNNVLNPRIILHIVEASTNKAFLVTTLHSWVYVCPTGWGIRLPLLQNCHTGFQPACVRCAYIYSKLYSLGFKGFIDIITRYFIYRRVVRCSNVLISPTKILKDHVVRIHSVKNVYQIYNPLPDEILYVKPTYSSSLRAVFLGRLEWEKGVHLLPFLALKNPDIEFYVLGRGRLSEYIKSYSKKLSNLKYYGYVSEERKREIIRNASIVLVPSIYMETFGYTVAEAFAYGKPVVGFNIGGVGELVNESGAGIVVKPYDANELAYAVREAIMYGERLGMKGKLFALRNFSTRNYYDSLKKIYEEYDLAS
jgi:glycosyltransferase involved in cell wall biosynthesis